jgi:deazaflavin-dependent oxidoreductase (nitroreductase family)
MSEPGAAPQKPPPRWVLKAFTRTHVFLNGIVGGRAFNTMGGREVCFVTMTGAKSGRQITNPLMYVPYGEGVLLVASLGGAPKNPVWYNNIVKHPDIEVRHRGRRMKLHARLATAEEKPALWPICDEHYPPYADYRARTTRDIPIFVCAPLG